MNPDNCWIRKESILSPCIAFGRLFACVKMCYSRFSEAKQQLIQFPEVDVNMFAELFLWVHTYNSTLWCDINTDMLIDLGIFCGMYQVHQVF